MSITITAGMDAYGYYVIAARHGQVVAEAYGYGNAESAWNAVVNRIGQIITTMED